MTNELHLPYISSTLQLSQFLKLTLADLTKASCIQIKLNNLRLQLSTINSFHKPEPNPSKTKRESDTNRVSNDQSMQDNQSQRAYSKKCFHKTTDLFNGFIRHRDHSHNIHWGRTTQRKWSKFLHFHEYKIMQHLEKAWTKYGLEIQTGAHCYGIKETRMDLSINLWTPICFPEKHHERH